VATGIFGPGFVNLGYDCSSDANLTAYKAWFSGNSCGSSSIGQLILNQSVACKGIYGFVAYKCGHGVDHFEEKGDLKVESLFLAENKVGAHLMVSGPKNHNLTYKTITVMARARDDCPTCYNSANASNCGSLVGLIIPNTVIGGGG